MLYKQTQRQGGRGGGRRSWRKNRFAALGLGDLLSSGNLGPVRRPVPLWAHPKGARPDIPESKSPRAGGQGKNSSIVLVGSQQGRRGSGWEQRQPSLDRSLRRGFPKNVSLQPRTGTLHGGRMRIPTLDRLSSPSFPRTPWRSEAALPEPSTWGPGWDLAALNDASQSLLASTACHWELSGLPAPYWSQTAFPQ